MTTDIGVLNFLVSFNKAIYCIIKMLYFVKDLMHRFSVPSKKPAPGMRSGLNRTT